MKHTVINAQTGQTSEIAMTEAEYQASLCSPDYVTSLQFRRAVKARGKRTQFLNWLSQQNEDTQEYFQFSAVIRKTDPEFVAFVAVAGFTPEQVNNFFYAASHR
jgi:hypothetical protein